VVPFVDSYHSNRVGSNYCFPPWDQFYHVNSSVPYKWLFPKCSVAILERVLKQHEESPQKENEDLMDI
jgi:hypothetical protein